jgi:hypothetical protein
LVLVPVELQSSAIVRQSTSDQLLNNHGAEVAIDDDLGRSGSGIARGTKIEPPHSITSSAVASSVRGRVRPSVLAALR